MLKFTFSSFAIRKSLLPSWQTGSVALRKWQWRRVSIVPHRAESLFIYQTSPMLCLLQALSRGVFMHQSGKEPGLWLHQFRLIRLGLSLAVQTDDARRLGEPIPAGGQHIYRNLI